MITAFGRHDERSPTMTTQGTEPAATLAGTDTGTTVDTGGAGTSVSSTDDDGILDLDALANEQSGASDIEDGSLEGDDPDADAAKLAEKPAAETEEEKAKKLSGSQRAKIREQRLLDDIATRDRELETLRARGTTTKAPEAGGVDPNMPKEADFNGDYFAFTEARSAYVAGKAAKEAAEGVFKSREDAAATQRETARQTAIMADHLERVDTAKSVITDYDQVMEGMKGVNVSESLIGLIKGSDNSAVIAYKLAGDPELLKKIDRMTPLQQAREIGRMEVTEQLPERKTQTKADAPLTKTKGSAPGVKSQEQQLSSWLDKKYPNRKK
jgi:hypothetical protein